MDLRRPASAHPRPAGRLLPHSRERLGRPAERRPRHLASGQQGRPEGSPGCGNGPARVQASAEGA
eukprot:2363697-Alexandrium_andersonii.AAC.1